MRQNKLKHLMYCLVWLTVSTALAQSNTLTAGGDATSTDGSVSYSIGQLDYVEATGSGGTASQGVQQPFEIIVLGSDDFRDIQLIASVYPNPTVDHVTLTIRNMELEDMEYQLYDMSGRILQHAAIRSSEMIVSMDQFSSATYFLAVIGKGTLLKTFKIIKH